MSVDVDVDSIDLDDIAIMGARLANGIYDVKLIDVQAGVSQKGDPLLKPTFEVTSGDSKGLTHQGMYFLGTFKSEAGKVRCFGVTNIKRDAMELGVVGKLPNPFPLDPNKARVAYAKAFKNVKMRLHIQDGEPSKSNGKVYKEFRLLPGVTTSAFEDVTEEEIVY